MPRPARRRARDGERNGDSMEECVDENLTKALHCVQFAGQDLQAALKSADAVSGLLLLTMIADAARLEQQVSGLLLARADVRREAVRDEGMAP